MSNVGRGHRFSRARGPLIVAGVVALLAAGVAFVLVRDMFIFTEARWYLLLSPPIDWAAFLFQPAPDWGQSRPAGVASFQLTASVCGVDATCVNAAGALLAGLCAAVLVVHGWQLSGSLAVAGAAAVAWVFSAPTLAALLWQAARFDLLVLIGALGLAGGWWTVLGRRQIGRAAAIAFVVGSVAALAVTLNAKENAYYLVGVLPLVALVRGLPNGRVRRNALLAALPLAYAAYFIGWALTHVSPEYAGYITAQQLATGLQRLVQQAMGIDAALLYFEQHGPALDLLRLVAQLAYAVLAGVLALAVLLAWRRRRAGAGRAAAEPEAATARRRVASLAPELYLALTLAGTTLIGAPSGGASTHYMVIPYWAGTLLLLLVMRRIAAALPRPRVALAALLALALVPATLAYASQLAGGSVHRLLGDVSAEAHALGDSLQRLLAGRSVESVHWRTVDSPRAVLFVLRSGDTDHAGDDLWPFLLENARARPTVELLLEGMPAELPRPDRPLRRGCRGAGRGRRGVPAAAARSCRRCAPRRGRRALRPRRGAGGHADEAWTVPSR